MSDASDSLAETFPSLRELLTSIDQLRNHIVGLPLPAFLEPVTVGLIVDGVAQPLAVDAASLTSWTRHIGFSTRVRLLALEPAILESFAASRVLAGMVLLRAHLEASALAAHCLRKLTDAARSSALPDLGTLIQQTLFGTSLRKQVKTQAWLDNHLSTFQQGTIQITPAVSDLDRHVYQDLAKGTLNTTYSLLCEYSHPNLGGVRHLMSAIDSAAGWAIQYSTAETPEGDSVSGALTTLDTTMRAGYSAAELLLGWHFCEDGANVDYRTPSKAHLKSIWTDIIKHGAT